MGKLTTSPICDTGSVWYANNVACGIDEYISDFVTAAQASETALDDALATLSTAWDTNVVSPTYSANTSGVSKTFVAPTTIPARGDYDSLEPDEIVLPSRAGLLTEAQSNAIYARARSRVTRALASGMRAALDQPASLGIGMAAPALTARVDRATQNTIEATERVALEQAAQEGIWEREDIAQILQLEQENVKNRWEVIRTRLAAEEDTLRSSLDQYRNELAREAERRGWSQMEINDILKQAEDGVNTLVAWGQATLGKLLQVELSIVQQKAAVFQTWLQAARLGLTFQGSQSITGEG